MKQMPNYQLYREIAFRPEDWSILVKKMGELFRKDFDWSEQIASIKSPIMLVVEDSDAIRTSIQ
jgi:hypothetical protein